MEIDYSNLDEDLVRKALFIFHSNMIESIFVSLDDTLRLLEPSLVEEEVQNSWGSAGKKIKYTAVPAQYEGKSYHVLDHAEAYDYAMNYDSRIPITQGFIWKIHRLLMETDFEKRKKQEIAGKYREGQVYVGDHIPPKAEVVHLYMESFIEAVQSLERPTEEQLWTLHNEFLYIHPFIDGNGRTSRILLNALRKRYGFDFHIVQYEKREEYYRHLEDYEELRKKKDLIELLEP